MHLFGGGGWGFFFFFAYQEVIEHDLENLCKMDISPSTLII